jgi:hypothetical protein
VQRKELVKRSSLVPHGAAVMYPVNRHPSMIHSTSTLAGKFSSFLFCFEFQMFFLPHPEIRVLREEGQEDCYEQSNPSRNMANCKYK